MHREIQRETRTVAAEEFRFAEAPHAAPVVSGYAAVYNKRSRPIRAKPESFIEIMRPGAFADAIAKGTDVPLLIDHKGLPLARTSSGTLTLSEDSTGLFFRAELDPDDPDVLAILPKLRRRDVRHMSFGFYSPVVEWNHDGRYPIREVLSLELVDVSIVGAPAYLDAYVNSGTTTPAPVRAPRRSYTSTPGPLSYYQAKQRHAEALSWGMP